MRILLVFNTAAFYLSHWSHLVLALCNANYEVHVAVGDDVHANRLLGETRFRLHRITLSRRRLNPVSQIITSWQLYRLYKRVQPSIVHHFTIKPVILGTLMARMAKISMIVNSITGLGFVFSSSQWKAKCLRPVIRACYSFLFRADHIQLLFENADDRQWFIQKGYVKSSQVTLVPGAGVDLDLFHPTTGSTEKLCIMLVGRMLWDKGIGEFVAAAAKLREKICARFVLVGGLDVGNPAAISETQLLNWVASGVVEWWGQRSDMVSVLGLADIVCLPSYREGMPRALIEAAACGKALVATDVPGCRDLIQHGYNGLLVSPKDAEALADQLLIVMENPVLRRRLGICARETVVGKFSLAHSIAQHMNVYAKGKMEARVVARLSQ